MFLVMCDLQSCVAGMQLFLGFGDAATSADPIDS